MFLSLPPDWENSEGRNDNIHLCNPQITNYTVPGLEEGLNEWRMETMGSKEEREPGRQEEREWMDRFMGYFSSPNRL